MAIPTTGSVTFDQVATETGYSGTDATALNNSCNNTTSPVQVDHNAPYNADEFRGYDHLYAPIDSGTLSINNTGVKVDWSATANAKATDVTGYFKVRFKGSSDNVWHNDYNVNLTVYANQNLTKTGNFYIDGYPTGTDVTVHFLFDDVLLDEKLTVYLGGGGGL